MDGTPFGRYRLVELLGRGGMGEVWRAHDTVTDRVVAVKVLPQHLADDNTFVKRFRREAHAAARLDSPHVVPIHTYGEIDGRLYVDMRLIKGHDLQTVLAEGPLPPARAVRIIEQVAEALHAAHEIGLVHRDVKPSNILLDKNDFAYLIDFGIARAAEDTKLTGTGSMIGTLQYLAPERLGTGEVDAHADIYALACVLYECLTGRPPFPEQSPERLMSAHLNTPPPQPSTTQPEVPAGFDDVIATGMAKDPDQRYATTVELASAAQDAITTPIPKPPVPQSAPNAPTPPPAYADDVFASQATRQRGKPADLSRVEVRSKRPLRAAVAVPVILVMLLLGATSFAAAEFTRSSPGPSTAAPQWQPYVDYGKQFVAWMLSISAATVDSDIQRIVDGSTGSFHDDFVNRSADFKNVTLSSKVTSHGTVTAAGLESLDGATAQVVIYGTSAVANSAGPQQQPRNFRFRTTVVKIGDTYKVSQLEIVP